MDCYGLLIYHTENPTISHQSMFGIWNFKRRMRVLIPNAGLLLLKVAGPGSAGDRPLREGAGLPNNQHLWLMADGVPAPAQPCLAPVMAHGVPELKQENVGWDEESGGYQNVLPWLQRWPFPCPGGEMRLNVMICRGLVCQRARYWTLVSEIAWSL